MKALRVNVNLARLLYSESPRLSRMLMAFRPGLTGLAQTREVVQLPIREQLLALGANVVHGQFQLCRKCTLQSHVH